MREERERIPDANGRLLKRFAVANFGGVRINNGKAGFFLVGLNAESQL